uniref:Uncharacterized protein n=1 Tax=Aegilops tauschii subsp. strangulata TaxID=200361 RepID=A0A453MWX8_AEGTS
MRGVCDNAKERIEGRRPSSKGLDGLFFIFCQLSQVCEPGQMVTSSKSLEFSVSVFCHRQKFGFDAKCHES